MRLLSSIFSVLALLQLALADVSIKEPSDTSYSASGGLVSIPVSWKDDGDSDDTDLSKVQWYSLVLCTGSNSAIDAAYKVQGQLSAKKTSSTIEIDSDQVPNGQYFVQVYAKFDQGYTIHYSNRFKLTGMKGDASTLTFKSDALTETGDAPSPQINVQADTSINSAWFTIPYTKQTGKTRYAPMQTQPAGSVTATTYSRREATSAYTPFKSISPSPNVHSTITPGWSYSVTSKTNTNNAAPYPTYYYPASSRVQKATLSNAKKRRWLE